MPNKGGVKEAAKLLSGLDHDNRLKVLEIIAKQDPQMAELLRKNLVVLEDLLLLTPRMVLELTQEVGAKDMGLALRISTQKLKGHILSNLPKLLRAEIEEILLGPPQAVNKVQESTERVLQIVRFKIEKGELILNKNGDDYV